MKNKKMIKVWLSRLLTVVMSVSLLFVPDVAIAADATSNLKNFKLTILQDGKPVDEGGTIYLTKTISFDLSFDIPVAKNESEVGSTDLVQHGDTATIELGRKINIMGSNLSTTTSGAFALDGTVVIPELGRVGRIGEADFETVGDTTVIKVIFNGDEILYDGKKGFENVTASIRGSFEADSSLIGENGEPVEIRIFNQTFKLARLLPTVNVALEKSGEADEKNGVINWTVTALAPKDYKFQDDLTNVGEYVDGSFTVDGVQKNLDSDSTSTKLIYTFDENITQDKKIQFKTKITKAEIYSTSKLTKTNTAQILNKDSVVEKEAPASLVIESKTWVKKSFLKYDSKTNNITWRIRINEPALPLEDVVITDVLPEGLEFVSAQWQKGTEGSTTYVNDGEKITQKPDDDKYRISSVDTPMQLLLETKVISGSKFFRNTVSMNWSGNITERTFTAEARLGGGGITKTGTTVDGSRNIKWTVKVDATTDKTKIYDVMIFDRSGRITDTKEKFSVLTGQPQGIEIGDLWPQTNNLANGYMKFLPETFKNLNPNMNLDVKVYPLKKGNVHMGDLVEISGGTPGETWEFEFEARPDWVYTIQDPLKIPTIYNTVFLFEDTTMVDKPKNLATVRYKSRILDKETLEADEVLNFKNNPTAESANKKTTDVANGFNHETHSIIYRLSLNGDGHKDLLKGIEKLKVKDVLPEGWEFVNIVENQKYVAFRGEPLPRFDSSQVTGGENSDSNKAISKPSVKAVGDMVSIPMDAVFSTDNKDVEFTLKEELDGPYVILLEAKPTDEQLKKYLSTSTLQTHINTAILTNDKDKKVFVTATQKSEIKTDLLSKSWILLSSDEGILEWTIDYKPYDMITTDNVSLEDVLSQGMELRRDEGGNLLIEDIYGKNFALYEMKVKSDGTLEQVQPVALTEGINIKYDSTARKLTVDIPDKTKAYQLVYKTDITGIPGQKIDNKVSLVGSDIQPDTPTSSSYEITTAYGSGSYRLSGKLEITKKNVDNEPLEGAGFTISSSDGTPIATAYSSAAGKIRFSGLQAGTYKLQETKAPDGYVLDDYVYTVKVVRNSAVDVVVTVMDKNGNPFTQNFEITNEKQATNPTQPETGSLIIQKTVVGDEADNSKTFGFTVNFGSDLGSLDYEGTVDSVGSGTIVSGGKIFLSNGQGIKILNIPKDTTYTVVEDDYTADGYVLDVSNSSGATGIIEGTKVASFLNIFRKVTPSDPTTPTNPTTPGGGGGGGGTDTPVTPPPTNPTTPANPTTPGGGGGSGGGTNTPVTPPPTNPTTPTDPTTPGGGGGGGGTDTPVTPSPNNPFVPVPNVPFTPTRIDNVDVIPQGQTPVFTIVDDENIPLGNAVIDPQNNTFTFIEEEKVPLGVAVLHDDNSLEILDEEIPLGTGLQENTEVLSENTSVLGSVKILPKTGEIDYTAIFYVGGSAAIALGFVMMNRRKNFKNQD